MYIVEYCGCPIIWVSKLQTLITLSTAEAEYVALSHSLRDIFPIMNLLREFCTRGFKTIGDGTVDLSCRLFEDNNGALELARQPRYRPRTKHIAIKYHHFREHVKTGKVSIEPIDTKEQIADQFTKALQPTIFKYLRYKLLGW